MDAKFLLGGQLYLIGGRNNSSNGNMDSDSVERYDPLYDEWSNVASLTVPRNRLGVAVVDGVVYAVGGSDGIKITFSIIISFAEGTSPGIVQKSFPFKKCLRIV